ncbi:hypothetical protein JYU34_017935 [Plutella xylostella]|uniref:Uncharacterized protein n=1 Tax=Plutella xylostella TaxID=51655 RepID=A0ABQ7PZC3_PLUXY|nr:hypothetical protein JYU34_017935 [Plutella xylostella]
MEFDSVIVKDSPGLCRCCLAEGCYKELGAPYFCGGHTEVYGDMLMECFDICISQQTDGPNGPNRHICEVCIGRLRDATEFKRQVLESEKTFIDMVARKDFKGKMMVGKKEMKKEPGTDVDPDVNMIDTADVFDDDTDEEPLSLKRRAPRASGAAPRRRGVKTERKKARKNDESEEELLSLKSGDEGVDAAPLATPRRASEVKTEKRKRIKKKTEDAASKRTRRLNPSLRRRRNLEILFNNTSVIPFKWRGKYLCFYCGKDIADYTELRKHTKGHGNCHIKDYSIRLVRSADVEIKVDISEIVCEICNEPFSNLEDIKMHLSNKHHLPYDQDVELSLAAYRLVDLNCMECDEKFTFFRHLVNHVNTRHPKNVCVCDKCSQSFNKRRDLESHIRNYHQDGYKCDECDSEFASNTKLRAHKETEHLHTCNVCFDRFTSSAKKMKHIDKVHLSSGVLECGFCQRNCSTRQAFLQHTSKCKVRKEVFDRTDPCSITIDDADEKKPTVATIRNNLASIFNMSTAIPFKFFMNRFRCFFCPKDFADSDALKEHTVLEHPVCDTKHKSLKLRSREDVDIKVDIASLKCKVCYENMLDLNTLIDHLVLEHKASYDKSVDCKIIGFKLLKDNFTCPLCSSDESYRFFGNLLKHMNEAHSNNQLVCVFCGKTFRTDPNLRSHIARHHKPGKIKCTDCDLVFPRTDRLNYHLAKHHGKKVVKCPKCPEKFVSTYLRQKHLINIHNSGSSCSHCGRMFTCNSLMREHVRRTHLKEKTVECQVCNMKFFDNFMLRMHMVRHAGDRNFHCDKCGKKFLWKKNLRNHMTTHEKHASQTAGGPL